jgi:hypothetical protein
MTSQQSPTLVSTKETDYLDEDAPIRGQNYVCLSFLSPEEVLRNKEAWIFERYMSAVGNELKTMLDTLSAKYPEDKGIFTTLLENYNYLYTPDLMQDHYRFFKQFHGEKLETEFHELNQFQTTVRGIKVRGVYDTIKEAQHRAELLKKKGDKFDIFIGQVGVWCPWSPNPNEIQEQEYAETQLNTVMKQYKENMELKDLAFEERKTQKIANANVRSTNVNEQVMEDGDVPTYSQQNA